ncbi:MAG: TadE/TadG family type IV pilus assembly protein [Gammaproteobacteria bacterium]
MKNQRCRGAIAVEIVLLAPLMLLFVFLIFEFGRVFGSWLIITNSGREGARVAITQNCDNFDTDATALGRINSRVQETAQFLTVNAVACSGSYDSCINVTRQTQGFEVLATVNVGYKVYTLMPITGNIPYLGSINYPGYLEVVGRSTMRCE